MNLTCRTCRQSKPEDEYYKDKQSRTGRQSRCKVCTRAASAANYEAHRSAAHADRGNCTHCGQELKHQGATYCSAPECQKARDRSDEYVSRRRQWFRDNPDKAREYYKKNEIKRKRLLAGARTDNVTWHGILERDHWTCQLCGDPINREIKAPHPKSPSWDHVVPLSQGGDHTWANLQAAHFGCNARKCNRGEPQQLALI